jgi:hypothetical protein
MNVGHFGTPGVGAADFSVDFEIIWGGDESKLEILRDGPQFDSAMVDAANTPTSVIRKGMLLGQVTATSKVKQWDPAATDGTQTLVGVLGVELHMVDGFFVAVDRRGPMIVRAPLKAKFLKIAGAALVGNANEYLARNALAMLGCLLDDDKTNSLSGIYQRQSTKITNYTVVAADNNTRFTATTADATFTLPTIRAGLKFEFLRASDHNLVITSAAGDDIIVGNDLTADSITYSTAGNKIGARVTVEAIYVGAALRWLATINVAPFSTGTLLTQTLAT